MRTCQILYNARQTVLRPVSDIGDRHHQNGNEQKVDASLFCQPPSLHVPDHGTSGASASQQAAQERLYDNGAYFTSHHFHQFRQGCLIKPPWVPGKALLCLRQNLPVQAVMELGRVKIGFGQFRFPQGKDGPLDSGVTFQEKVLLVRVFKGMKRALSSNTWDSTTGWYW